MLLRKSIIVLVLLALVAAMAAVSVNAASAGQTTYYDKGYYLTVGTPSGISSYSLTSGLLSPMAAIGNTIIQSQYQYAQKTVTGYYTTFPVDLKWNYPVNSLGFTIYTPDGVVLGPVYDNFENLLNGDIPVKICKTGGVTQGTYYFEIYGDRVTGTQTYTFNA